MERVEGVMRVGGLHTPSVRGGSQFPGALATSRQEIARALGRTGFACVAGQPRENFRTCLNRKPFEIEVSELRPGALREFMTWIAKKLSSAPGRAEGVQAHVRPERAVKLLK